jgi:hypothetical protein
MHLKSMNGLGSENIGGQTNECGLTIIYFLYGYKKHTEAPAC